MWNYNRCVKLYLYACALVTAAIFRETNTVQGFIRTRMVATNTYTNVSNFPKDRSSVCVLIGVDVCAGCWIKLYPHGRAAADWVPTIVCLSPDLANYVEFTNVECLSRFVILSAAIYCYWYCLVFPLAICYIQRYYYDLVSTLMLRLSFSPFCLDYILAL